MPLCENRPGEQRMDRLCENLCGFVPAISEPISSTIFSFFPFFISFCSPHQGFREPASKTAGVGKNETTNKPGTGSSFLFFFLTKHVIKKSKREEPVPWFIFNFYRSHTCGFARRLAKTLVWATK